jgi:hypothetical protein
MCNNLRPARRPATTCPAKPSSWVRPGRQPGNEAAVATLVSYLQSCKPFMIVPRRLRSCGRRRTVRCTTPRTFTSTSESAFTSVAPTSRPGEEVEQLHDARVVREAVEVVVLLQQARHKGSGERADVADVELHDVQAWVADLGRGLL